MPSKKPRSKLARSISTIEYTIYVTCQMAHIVGRDDGFLVIGAPEELRALYILSKDICPICDGKGDESSLMKKTLSTYDLFLLNKINYLGKSLRRIPEDFPNDDKSRGWVRDDILSYASERALLKGIMDGKNEEKYRGINHCVYRCQFCAAYGKYKKARDKITDTKSDAGSGNAHISISEEKRQRRKANHDTDIEWARQCGMYIGR